MTLKSWLQNAFAVETHRQPPTDAESAIIERVAKEVVRRGMTVPAIAFLEMARPLNYLGSQTMRFFEPIVNVLLDPEDYSTFAEFLERRDAIDRLCERIQKCDEQQEKAIASLKNKSEVSVEE